MWSISLDIALFSSYIQNDPKQVLINSITQLGFYIHKNTPENIRSRLADVCRKIADAPDFKKGIGRLGEEPTFGSPDFIRDAIKRQEEIGIPILKEIGLYIGK